MTDPREQAGSRLEAAAAGVRHEHAEVAEHLEPREHVTAAPASEHPHLHHPEDPNDGVIRGRIGRGALVAAFVAAALTTLGVVALALAIGGR
jgi:hypothetical protein